MHRRVLTLILAIVAVIAVTGCGLAAAPSPSTPKPTPAPTPTPTPGPDLNERLDVGNTGVGVYQLVTVPVAIIHNASTQHSAMGVVVHFAPSRNGRVLDHVDSPTVAIPPGATVAVTANCTDTCAGANHTDVSVSVTSWGDPKLAPAVTTTDTAFARGGGGSGAGFGSVTTTLNATSVPAGAAITVFAACSQNNVIVGGGYSQDTWVTPATPQKASVSVIVSTSPDHCDAYSVLGS